MKKESIIVINVEKKVIICKRVIIKIILKKLFIINYEINSRIKGKLISTKIAKKNNIQII